jgi:peptide/nickel transport system substrate-binding protein
MMLVALVAAGCGAKSKSSTTAGGGGGVLRIPYLADMSVPDPDVFYDIEGNAVILNTYEGLLKYAPDSTNIVPALAESYTVSPDKLTYTFKIRQGVKFHSGAPVTSAAVKAAFKRRLDVDQAPAYMLKPVKSMTTPDASTFVITLKQKINPFLAYLASSWGPKVVGPEAITTNAGKDFGQKWMSTHEDGTGPFKLTAFQRGRQYTLTRNDTYWGGKPAYKQVLIKIIPDVGTQRIELQNGGLDAVMHSFPASELASLGDSVKIVKKPSFLRLLMYVNTNKAPFNDPAVRAGLRSTIDINQLVKEAYSDTAAPSTGVYPPALLSGQPTLPYKPDDVAAKAAASKASTKKLSLGYTVDESGVERRVAEIIQNRLKSAGYEVTLKEVQLPETYAYIKHLKTAPDLLLATNTPDAANPDTWARILFYSTGGLNFLGYANKSLDADLDKALDAPEAQATKLYNAAGQKLIDDNAIFFLGDVKDVFVLRKSLGGIEHVPAYPWTLSYDALKPA